MGRIVGREGTVGHVGPTYGRGGSTRDTVGGVSATRGGGCETATCAGALIGGRGSVGRGYAPDAFLPQRFRWRCGVIQRPAKLLAQQYQLPVQFAPFAHAQEAEEVLLAPVAQLRLAQVLVRLTVGLPELQDADELRVRIGELGMCLVGGLAPVGGALARILDAEKGGDGQHRTQHAVAARGDQHACQRHVHRPARHGAADVGETTLAVHRAQLLQLLPAVGNGARVGRFQEREVLQPPEPERQHAQDHARQRGAQDFRIGIARPALEIVLRVEPEAHPRCHPPAASGALVGAGLRDRFDMQALELAARAVALHPRKARIDHVADAWHGERGLGHVGRQHDAPLRTG